MKSNLRPTLGFGFLGILLFAHPSFSQLVTTNGSDNAGNYSGGWTNGANGGTGFGPWALSSGNGTSGFGGTFTGIPGGAGVTGISSDSFGLYANPSGSGAFANAERTLSAALAIGQTLSFKWAINWDSGFNGAKGFDLLAGSSQIFNINNGGSSTITLNGGNVFTNYGTTAMTWSFTRTATNSCRVTATGRNGTDFYSNNITVANGAIDKIKFYAYQLQAGDAAQPYFNDFLITTTTADVTPPVIALVSNVSTLTWVAKNGTINLANSDVTATDNSGTANVSFAPSSINTANDGLTTVTYTATDGSGNTATVTRVIAVGDAAPDWRKVSSPSTAVSYDTSATLRGRIYIDGATPGSGQAPAITAQVGISYADTDPATWDSIFWLDASYNPLFTDGDDEYQATVNGWYLPAVTSYYAFRFRIGNGAWQYAGINAVGTDGGPWNGTTSGNGVLTLTDPRFITFSVDMGVQIFRGTFNPDLHTMEVRGEFNGWGGGSTMTAVGGASTLYSATLPIVGTNGAIQNYKFFGTGTNGLAWEARADRSLTLSSFDQTLPAVFFNDLSESRKITFRVDMSVQIAKGNFNPATNTVSVAGTLSGWVPIALSSQGNGVYAAEVLVDGPLSGVEYKFLKDSTFEGVGNRTVTGLLPNLTASTLDAVWFSNDDGVGPVITLNGAEPLNLSVGDTFTDPGATATDAIDGSVTVTSSGTVNTAIPGTYTITYNASDAAGNAATTVTRTVVVSSSFANWGGGVSLNSANLAKYAFGGASSPTATDGKDPSSTMDATNLVMTVIVRTNDPKLLAVGRVTTSLAPGAAETLVNGVEAADQSNVPVGCKRMVYSVPQGSDGRKFLRVTATLQP